MRIGVPPWKKASATRFTLSQIEQHREKCVATSYAHVPASWTSDCIALLLIERHLISVRHSGLLIEKHLRVWCKTLIHTDGSYSCKAQRARGRPTPQQQATLLFFYFILHPLSAPAATAAIREWVRRIAHQLNHSLDR